ncbi:hypothetical protein K525DRAFT_205573 [Schizophyllum commune Loenen D]|nr:hypothetical protein K525DRAFT_205573 [Schizophyllum commune Loenen D]
MSWSVVVLHCLQPWNLSCREQIRCTSRTCKFSPNHPSTCMPPRCTLTCWQYRQFPEQYSPNISSYCPSCLGRRHQ